MNLLLPLILLFAGCASWDSLKPGVERVCVGDRCYMFGDEEQINRHCNKGGGLYDDGTPVGTPGWTTQCCVSHHPGHKRRFHFWISRSNMDCIPHEECHVALFKKGIEDDHSECHDFGYGAGKTRM